MASQNKIIQMIGAIKTIYSYYARDTDVEMLVRTWSALLKDYPDDVTEAAFYKCLQTCKTPPTPADVLENIHSFAAVNEPTDEDLWAVYMEALHKTLRLMYYFQFNYVDPVTGMSQGDKARQDVEALWQGLPEKIKMYLASKGELMRRARELDGGDMSFERSRFMRTMPAMKKRQEYNMLLTSGVGRMLLE